MSLVARIPALVASDKVQQTVLQEYVCSASLEIPDLPTREIILSRQVKTKVLISLCNRAANLLLGFSHNYAKSRFSHDVALITYEDRN